MDAIYEVHGLTKRYGRTAALNGVDFAVTPGKLVGQIGRASCRERVFRAV